MLHQPIATINGVGIVTVEHDGEIFVPIKPICDALGIAVDAQRNKLNSDEFFNSTTSIIDVVAADEKTRERRNILRFSCPPQGDNYRT